MAQQGQRNASGVSHAVPTRTGATAHDWIDAETVGRERLRQLLEQWIRRNGWSLAVVSRLTELSLLAEASRPIRDWSAGMPLESGDWVVHRGHAWEAVGSPLLEPAEATQGWIDHGLTSRLHASGLNLYLRNRKSSLTVSFLLEIGRLNEWLAKVKAGKACPPTDPRLSELVKSATVLRDSDGPLGPEELLSIAGNRLSPPPWPDEPGAVDLPDGVSARQLRAAAAAAGLDIVEDWHELAALYPCAEPARLDRLQQVLLGRCQWDAQQQEDERTACVVLLQKLEHLASQRTASVVVPVQVREISGAE